ncbi:MAG: ShlB/FhaC/HecB family hemolysin secretion/activation protein [Gammaproteobacteria bacterium]|nr:ShlB/FhaC/HecB family hemolysin secretion/activation protein [Gammaproteobacteria bacterium]MBU1647026.1 ShlB/FhaC/HecB family hemolysin secretion/activation protein [Gammaproteobacteria bacterium]MBU1972538.1 ShlB/FhaC/HecB family hemolysin secretion/activation protein [Gammaproteobacteria bacterium]
MFNRATALRGHLAARLARGAGAVWASTARRIRPLGAPIAWLLLALPAAAAAVTDELLRQQERERALRQQREQVPDVRLERPTTAAAGLLPAKESPCFVINRIVLKTTELDRPTWEIWAAEAANRTTDGKADPAKGRCLGTRGVNVVMGRIQSAIVARGYVTTRVLAAPQDLSGGTLELTIVPGRIRAVRLAEGSGPHRTLANAVPARPGNLLDLRDIEHGLENLKRVPSAEADIRIEPADAADGAEARPGESDLVVAWKQGFPLRASLSLDDGGSKATGKTQAGLILSFDRPLGLDDLLYLGRTGDAGGRFDDGGGAHGTRGYVAHYSVPFDYWLLAFNASGNRYRQSVAGANQTYLYSGDSRNADIKLARLVYRDAARKTTLSVRGWYRASRNFIDDTEVEVQRRRQAGLEAGLSHREFIGAATLDADLAWRFGSGAFETLHAPEEAFGEGSSRPELVIADLRLNLPFAFGGQRLRYAAAVRAQWDRTALVPQDRFAIGGRYTVRGLDGETVLSAERGWTLRNDLGWSLGQTGAELYLGLDHGEVAGPGSHALAGTRLAGAVVGLRGAWKGFSYDAFAGQPIDKPKGFKTAEHVAGFNLNWTF